jgi:hypothetical protein
MACGLVLLYGDHAACNKFSGVLVQKRGEQGCYRFAVEPLQTDSNYRWRGGLMEHENRVKVGIDRDNETILGSSPF